MASRYNLYDLCSSTSSYFSDPASSTTALKPQKQKQPTSTSRALVKSKTASTKTTTNNSSVVNMVKKFMENKSLTSKGSSNRTVGLVIPSDVIADDLKKMARKGGSFGGLQRKLFGGKVEKKSDVKPLTEVKGGSNANSRTLAMVLRSERELLNDNKEQRIEISRLKMLVEEKNKEVEKLKDLCLKQREEVKTLKGAILFPDAMNLHLQDLLEKQGSELRQAKQVIPTLQRQVNSLTGQLQCLAEDLAEVKAEKISEGTGMQCHGSCPRTPTSDHEDPSNSLEFSPEGLTTPGSPDGIFLEDLNPCLTPFSVKTKTKGFEAFRYDSIDDKSFCENHVEIGNEFGFNSRNKKLSKSSDCCHNSIIGNTTASARPTRNSDESKRTFHIKSFN